MKRYQTKKTGSGLTADTSLLAGWRREPRSQVAVRIDVFQTGQVPRTQVWGASPHPSINAMPTYKITALIDRELTELIVAKSVIEAEDIFAAAHPEIDPLRIEVASVTPTEEVLAHPAAYLKGNDA